MKKVVMLVLAVLFFTANGYAADAKIVVTTGGIGGVYYYYGTQIAEILSKNNIPATAIQTAASVDNMLLLRDKSDPVKNTYFIGTVLPDTAFFTVTGKHEKFAEKPANGTIFWMMYPNVLHIVTSDNSGIKQLSDLDGKRVSTGAPGSGTEFTALNLLQAAKIDPNKFQKWEKLGAKESDEALANGTLDAYVWSGGLPTGSIVELANTLKRKGTKLFLVPLPDIDPGVAAFKKEFSGLAVSHMIPKETYGTEADTPALAFWNMFVGPESMPEELVYNITKTVFENLESLHVSVKAATDTTAENAASFVGKTAIPHHPGAVRYFTEKGLVK